MTLTRQPLQLIVLPSSIDFELKLGLALYWPSNNFVTTEGFYSDKNLITTSAN